MFGNISNHELFGDWSRLEDDYLGCNGMEDNFAFSKADKYPGFFRSGVTLIAATPVLNPETGRATRAWKLPTSPRSSMTHPSPRGVCI